MSLKIYKYHTDPSKLNHYEEFANDLYEIFSELKRMDAEEYEYSMSNPLARLIRDNPNHLDKIEKYLNKIENPIMCYTFAKLLRKPFPSLEKCISSNCGTAYKYATEILKGQRFPLGEPAIAQDPHYSIIYARDNIKGRFELGEKTMLKDFESYYYVRMYIEQVLEPLGLKVKRFNA